MLVLTVLFVPGVAFLDYILFFEAFSGRWLFAAIYLVVAAGWTGRSLPRWVFVLAVFAWTVAVLPQVRWHDGKSFYVDAHRLRPGMTVERVREIMDPHVELGVDYVHTADEWWFPEAPSRDTLIFLHSPEEWVDACTVTTWDGVVTAIEIVKD